MRIHLPVSEVLDPRFNVVRWYAHQLKQIFFKTAPESEKRKFRDDGDDDNSDDDDDNGHMGMSSGQSSTRATYPVERYND